MAEEKPKRLRKVSPKFQKMMEELKKKWEENPIVERLEDTPIPGITKMEHIKELQEILVQTCIDYINKNGLTDIWGVYFSADSLDFSAKEGEWTPSTDSYIKVEGIRAERHLRKNGEIFEMPYRYEIGEYM